MICTSLKIFKFEVGIRKYIHRFLFNITLITSHSMLQVIKTRYSKIYQNIQKYIQDMNKYIQHIQDIYKIGSGPAGRPAVGPEAVPRPKAKKLF